MACNGPDNLHGESINSTSDDSSRVFVVDQRGQLKWQRGLAAAPSGAHCALADLDDDGHLEVVVSAISLRDNTSEIFVLGGTHGEVVATTPISSRVSGVLILRRSGSRRPLIVCGCVDQERVLGLVLSNTGELEIEYDRALPGTQPNGACIGDILGDSDPEIFMYNGTVGLMAFDATLIPMAYVPVDLPQRSPFVKAWQLSKDRRILVTTGRSTEGIAFIPEPELHSVRRAATIAALVIAAAVAALVVIRRRRAIIDSPGVIRELRRQLLSRLQVLRHEKFGTLENLERLIWYLEAAQEANPDASDPLAPVRALAADTRATTLVRLRDVVALAAKVSVREVRVKALAESCDELEVHVGQLEAPLQPEAFATILKSLREVEESLHRESRRIRAEVEAQFRAELPAVLGGVLRAHADGLAAANVVVTVSGAVIDPREWLPGSGPTIACDPDDLAFVLDNLVGNAVRAMSSMTRRELAVSWQAVGPALSIQFSDTGCGIPPDDWDRILAGEGSTRSGGGLGFRRTQEILGLYRGKIWFESSQAGGGTIIIVQFVAVESHARQTIGAVK